MKLLGLLFSFNGRMDRRRYWLVQLLLTLLVLLIAIWELLHIPLNLTGTDLTDAQLTDSLADPLALLRTQLHVSAMDWLLTALLAWPFIATQVRRFHDTDRSGWWTLINLLPMVGPLWTMIVTGFFRGTRGPNRFGPDPLEP